MKLLCDDDTYLDITPNDAKHKILVNYELVMKSDKKFFSIDRGEQTARYECEFTFRRDNDTIDNIYKQLQLLREASKPIVLSDMTENYFGDNVDHSGSISCVVTKISPLSSATKSTRVLKVTLLATDLSFIGVAQVGNGFKCLGYEWEGFNQWDFQVNETYFRNNYFVDYEKDLFLFTGTYMVSKADMRNLLAWHKLFRGSEYYTSSEQWGVLNGSMFGPNCPTIDNHVIISDMKYEILSPNLRRVEIELFRNRGGFNNVQ
jgi:hypothetical protein